jgi:hypothetical protein
MASITVNGFPVLSCRLDADGERAWTFRCKVHSDEALAGAVTITDGTNPWQGTVVTADVIAEECEALIVGGAGKLGDELDAKHYTGVPASVIAAAIVGDAGERLARASLGAAGLRRVLTYWSRAADTAGAELSRLVEDVGETWRLLPSGEVWIGTPSWLPTPAITTELDRQGGRRARVLAIDDLSLQPGTTVRGERVKRVEYRSQGGQLRATIWVP